MKTPKVNLNTTKNGIELDIWDSDEICATLHAGDLQEMRVWGISDKEPIPEKMATSILEAGIEGNNFCFV